jgi:rhamnose utilization protein RhaD (predicted bifunctional aldolase and dehydrogenase)
MNTIAELVEISRFYGGKKDYVIAGGGNTSYKNDDRIWVKASGSSMMDITAEGFAELQRDKLRTIYTKKYSDNSLERESEVKADLFNACVAGSTVRPSVETSLHEIIRYPFVVHTHPTLVNAITCSVDAEITINELFGDNAMYVEYTDPGYVLFQKIISTLEEWRKTHRDDPSIIFLQNHGVFVSADTTSEIKTIYQNIENGIKARISHYPDLSPVEVPRNVTEFSAGTANDAF